MNCHEPDFVIRIRRIAVGKQCHMREIVLGRGLFAAGSLIFVHGLLELGQIVQPVLAPLGPEHLLIAASVENIGKKLRDLSALPVQGEDIN